MFLFLYSVLKVRDAPASGESALYFVLVALCVRVFRLLQGVLVGSNGLEPSTSRLSGARSNHLSYEPIYVAGRFHRPTSWWRRTESNCRPPACKAGALPAELRPRFSRLASAERPPSEFPCGPSKLNSVSLTCILPQHFFRSTWMFEHLADARFSIERR